MKKWIVAGTVMNQITTKVVPFLVVAASQDEALGRAMRCMRKAFPIRSGYHSHFVMVKDADLPPLDPEQGIRVEDVL